MSADSAWRRCSSCKKEIAFQATYWVCNVSTCNRKRTGLVFCSTSCWDFHLPTMNHRESWAEERRAPTREAWRKEQAAEQAQSAPPKPAPAPPASAASEPRKILVRPAPTAPPAPQEPEEILVVVSKLKAYVRARSGMNTSDAVAEVLSDRLRRLCDAAIKNAERDGRKTILERDF